MKSKIISILALLLMAVAQSAWGESVTFTMSGSTTTYSNSYITVTFNEVSDGEGWLYSPQNKYCTITSKSGKGISSLSLTCVMNSNVVSTNHGSMSYSGSGVTISNVNSTSVQLGTSGNNTASITQITVNYDDCYTVSYNANGGSGSVASQTKIKGVNLTLASSGFTKTGYTLDGWATSASGNKAYNLGGNYTTNANATLYAHWTAKTYTVTLNKQEGTGGSNNVTATYDAAMPSATMPTRTGYTFNGYYDATSGGTQYYTASGASARTWNKTSNTTLYARWSVNSYTITFDTNGGSAIAAITQNYGTAVTAPANPTKDGYTFAGWDKAIPSTMPAENITITATWTKNELPLSENDDNSTAISTAAASGKIYAVTLTRTLQTGGWNTFCVPFNLATPTGWTVKELTGAEFNDGTLTLTFGNAASIVAGKPYLVKVAANVENPTFEGVTISSSTTPTTIENVISFVPVMSPTALTLDDKSYLFVKNGNKLTWASSGSNMLGFRAYFHILDSNIANARAFTMSFDDATGITTVLSDEPTTASGTYTLDGRRIEGQPTQKGVYIVNGKKTIIK